MNASLLENRELPAEYTGVVEKVRIKGDLKTLILSGGVEVNVPKSNCAGLDDLFEITSRSGRTKVEAICENGRASVLPLYRTSVALPDLGGRLIIREARDSLDLEGYERLAAFHYRAHQSFGRKAVLIAVLERGDEQLLVGYLEITNTFVGHQSRNSLLDAAFEDSSGIQWLRWDMKTRARYLNAIARISRCVVHPEFRGAGIGVALCQGALSYCRNHWHISRIKPLFLEITADMLKFVPFARQAGMSFIGTTSGNIGRVKRDQRYLNRIWSDIKLGLRDPESHAVFASNAKSMMQKQRGDVERIQKIALDQQLDVDEMLSLFLSAETPDGMSPTAYELLSSLLRFPKPTYMAGLTKDAAAFLSLRLSQCPPVEGNKVFETLNPAPLQLPIVVQDLTISYNFELTSSAWANAVREAFGIEKNVQSNTGVNNLNVQINSGDLVYVWGPSGSGKSGFLDALSGKRVPSSGYVRNLDSSVCAIFSSDFEERPAIELVGAPGLAESLYCMNSAGLSEASLYFKRPSMLSTGQRHRLAIARLIASKKPVWIIDEFCSVLDDTTAAIVAKNLRRILRALKVTAVIAGPRRDPVIRALEPNTVLNLNSLGTWSVERLLRGGSDERCN